MDDRIALLVYAWVILPVGEYLIWVYIFPWAAMLQKRKINKPVFISRPW